MLKTQITGAKYLSPQTNQMTNLNIAVPADSKDTEFGTSDILLAKDVVAYLNALDSDISNELDAQTDKINKINESIKQLIDHNLIKIVTELPTTDIDKNCIYLVPNKDGEGNNVFIEYIYVESKNTFEEVGRIQAKVDLSDYYTKEETDNQIQIAKNSAINIHKEDNINSIKLDIHDIEAVGKYESAVNASLIDNDNNATININAVDGFRHIYEGNESNLYSSGLDITGVGYNTYISSDGVYINNNDMGSSIEINANKNYTEVEQDSGYSPAEISLTDADHNANINAKHGFTHNDDSGCSSNFYYDGLTIDNKPYSAHMHAEDIDMYNSDVDGGITIRTNYNGSYSSPINISLTDGDHEANINAKDGFTHKTDDGFVATLYGYGLDIENSAGYGLHAHDGGIIINNNKNETQIRIGQSRDDNYLFLGSDEKFKISRPTDNTEGATITGVKSLTAFANPSATKVWATNGSTVDLTTKANASDVLLKKSASGGYYIESNSDELGQGAFAASSQCTASGMFAYAEGVAIASGTLAHAEGQATASGFIAHAEGRLAEAIGEISHAEGNDTKASGYSSHAQGTRNVDNKNAIHSVGIGNASTRKNAEYIYAKSNEDSSNLVDDPKNGYKYLIGVGGYDGINTDNTTYKSVQEVIADLTARIEQLETKVRAIEAANTHA